MDGSDLLFTTLLFYMKLSHITVDEKKMHEARKKKFCFYFFLKINMFRNAGLNTTQRWLGKYGGPSDWVVKTQRFGYGTEGWVKHLTQLLFENNPACIRSNIYPALGCI